MLWSLPGTDTKIRVFEEVKTEDKQYNIVDCGLQYSEGGIDSIAMGGSFHSVKNLCGQLDEKKAQNEADKKELEELRANEAASTTPVVTPEATPTLEPQAA